MPVFQCCCLVFCSSWVKGGVCVWIMHVYCMYLLRISPHLKARLKARRCWKGRDAMIVWICEKHHAYLNCLSWRVTVAFHSGIHTRGDGNCVMKSLKHAYFFSSTPLAYHWMKAWFYAAESCRNTACLGCNVLSFHSYEKINCYHKNLKPIKI